MHCNMICKVFVFWTWLQKKSLHIACKDQHKDTIVDLSKDVRNDYFNDDDKLNSNKVVVSSNINLNCSNECKSNYFFLWGQRYKQWNFKSQMFKR